MHVHMYDVNHVIPIPWPWHLGMYIQYKLATIRLSLHASYGAMESDVCKECHSCRSKVSQLNKCTVLGVPAFRNKTFVNTV